MLKRGTSVTTMCKRFCALKSCSFCRSATRHFIVPGRSTDEPLCGVAMNDPTYSRHACIDGSPTTALGKLTYALNAIGRVQSMVPCSCSISSPLVLPPNLRLTLKLTGSRNKGIGARNNCVSFIVLATAGRESLLHNGHELVVIVVSVASTPPVAHGIETLGYW